MSDVLGDVLEGIAIGDLHFDKLKSLFPETHNQLIAHEVRKALDYAIRKGLKYVFFLGDVCESSRLSYDALCTLIRLMKEYDGRLHMFWILGNHDFDEHGIHSLQPFVEMYQCGMFKTVHVFDKPTVMELKGIPVHFASYPCHEGKSNHVNVGHFEVSGSTRDNGTKIGKAHDTKHHWLMGHLHTPHTVREVFYAGTLYQLNFGESLPKGFLHFKYRMHKGKLQYKIERVANDPRFKLVNLVIESKRDFSKIENNPMHLYKLFINTGVEIPIDLMEKYPNIVKHDGFANKKELKALQEEAFIEIENQEIEEVSEEKFIRKFLKTKGRSPEQIERGVKLLQKAEGKLHDKPSKRASAIEEAE